MKKVIPTCTELGSDVALPDGPWENRLAYLKLVIDKMREEEGTMPAEVGHCLSDFLRECITNNTASGAEVAPIDSEEKVVHAERGGPRNSSIETSLAIIEAARGLSKVGDDDTIRMMRPVMEPQEINTRRNVAVALFGDTYGPLILDKVVYKNPLPAMCLTVALWIGWILAILSLFNVLPPYFSIIGTLISLPTIVILGYFFLITDIVKILLRKFDAW